MGVHLTGPGLGTVGVVLRHDIDGVAVLTIRRPETLNALNGDVYGQLLEHVTAVRNDPGIVALVLTGHGDKSFVSERS